MSRREDSQLSGHPVVVAEPGAVSEPAGELTGGETGSVGCVGSTGSSTLPAGSVDGSVTGVSTVGGFAGSDAGADVAGAVVVSADGDVVSF